MIALLQNDPRVPAGLIALHLQERKIPYRTVRLFNGEGVPTHSEYRAAVVLGGTMGVADGDRHPFLLPLKRFMRDAAESGFPLLGICLGGQLLCAALGGEVREDFRGEKGVREIRLTDAGREDPVFAGLPHHLPVFHCHNDSFGLPSGAVHLAFSEICPGQAFRYRRAYGIQFHPEVNDEIVSAWVRDGAADPAHASAFAASREKLAGAGMAMFENFLRLSGLLS